MEKRELYWDVMIDRTVAEREIANMQEQVHVLQIRIKELTETVYSLTHKVSVLGGDINQLELEL